VGAGVSERGRGVIGGGDFLIGCETSGVFREAFRAVGVRAWSCDLLASDDGSPFHIKGDVRDVMGRGWSGAVFHPTCTRLCFAGARWLYGPGKTHPKQLPKGRTWESLKAEFAEGVELLRACWAAPIERVAVENPEMHRHALDALSDLPRAHFVQPWWFGDPAFKSTGFFLRGFSPLTPTDCLAPPPLGSAEYRAWSAIHRAAPGPDRWKVRSRSFAGMAAAAAGQWGAGI
jgi:hypothetical protein